MKKGILFDMDGTLWDSARQVAESWNLAAAESGYPDCHLTTEDIRSVMGKTMDKIAAQLFPFTKGREREALLEACCRVENDYLREHGGMLYPDLRPTMEILKEKYHLYIVSNCQAGYIEAFLDHYDFRDLFEDIECYGNNRKQKGENIALLTKRNHLDRAVYVGDIQGDYDAASSAGLPFIHAAYGFGKISAEVPKIQGLAQLPQVVPSILDVE